MSVNVGLIAEDNSDISTIKELIKKLSPSKHFKIKKFVGQGCGKIVGKSSGWASHLYYNQGCKFLILIHDLDKRNKTELKSVLEKSLANNPFKKRFIIVIPIVEIESWLLADSSAIQLALNLDKKPSSVGNPELVQDPKSRLKEIIWFNSKKTIRYINTKHNELIASKISLKAIRKCDSFRPFEEFVLNIWK